MNTLRRLLSSVFVVALFALSSACANNPKPDTSLLDATGKRNLQLIQVVRGVNDVTSVAIAANKAGKLTDDQTALVLTIDKQVLDTIQAHPNDWMTLAVKAVDNARDALTPELSAVIGPYMQQILAALAFFNRE